MHTSTAVVDERSDCKRTSAAPRTACRSHGLPGERVVIDAGVSVSWVRFVPSGSISQRSVLVACGSNRENTISVPSGEKTGPYSDFENVSVSLCRFDPSAPTHQMSGWILNRCAPKTTADASGAHEGTSS